MAPRNKTRNKGRKGQFFSLDAVAGTAIFMIAVFLLAFYWLNAQAQMADQGVDLNRDAERIADQLLTQSNLVYLIETDDPLNPPVWSDVISYYLEHNELDNIEGIMPVASIGAGNGTIDNRSLIYFIAMGYDPGGLFSPEGPVRYKRMKDKLGIPQYEFYFELNEDVPARAPSPFCAYYSASSASGFRNMNCTTGFELEWSKKQVAIAERIVLYNPCIPLAYDSTPPILPDQDCDFHPLHLARLRVYVWR